MQVTYTFRHMEGSDALKAAVEEHLDKIRRYVDDESAKLHVIYETQKHHQRAELNLWARGVKTSVHADSEDMYQSVSQALDKLEKLLRRDKERRKNHH
ncbi:MAG: ribosome-associated translation inhibitor RaiA [Candidatus Dadabacteria bacterium]|nr:MAG: ribosome-associated translation inhibitor RaiA [Candidatus Dadabacteria bacterium]